MHKDGVIDVNYKSTFTYLDDRILRQWPFQSWRVNYVILTTTFIVAGTNMLAKMVALFRSRHDMGTVIEDLTPFMGDLISLLKLMNGVLKMDKTKELLLRVKRDYDSITAEDELNIMYDYAEDGRKFTIIYTGIFTMTMMSFMIPPLIPIITNNGTDRPFVHHTEFFVDPLDYYYPIIIQSYLTIFLFVTAIIAADTLLVVLVQHVCGLYTTLGYRLCHMTEKEGEQVDLFCSIENDESFKNISICIRRHQEAIEFSNLLDSYYSTTFFLQALVNTGGLSISGSQALKTKDTKMFFEHLSIVWSGLAHIFLECLNGQRLIDHSSRIHEYLIEAKWYQTSLRTRKIMNLMIIRSQYPCVLTAAGMLEMSMDTFSALVRTTMSYFTVLRSTQ